MKGVYIMANAKKLPSGNWRVRVFCGKDENGKSIIKSITADTRWKAEKAADEYLKYNKKDENIITVGEAIDGYIRLKENVLSPSTIRGYSNIRRNRLQTIMSVDIHEVNSLNMQMAINEDSKTHGCKSLKEAKALVCSALKLYGVRLELNVTLPAKKPKIKILPTAEQVISIIRGTDIELPCLLAMWLSLRMSEVRGLQFGDIKGNVITVQRSKMYFDGADHVRDVNKTYNSTRQLAIPPYIMQLIEAVPHNKATDFIVPMSYSKIVGKFKRILIQNELEMTFHDLRHLCASVMLKLGVPDKYAMERGGWSTNSTLKMVYQHTFSDERKNVDTKIDNYFNKIISGCDE